MANITIILVNPQLGENIGMSARSMLNFGFENMRIVCPRDGWPNEKAESASAGASSVIENAIIFDSLQEATADFDFIYATSARKRDLNLEVTSVNQLAEEIKTNHQNKEIAILFGQENSGLTNDHISSANKILTIPVSSKCSSINLATSVAVICHSLGENTSSSAAKNKSDLAKRQDIEMLTERLTSMLDDREFFQIPEKKSVMTRNVKNIFNRIPNFSKNEFNALMGIFNALHKD